MKIDYDTIFLFCKLFGKRNMLPSLVENLVNERKFSGSALALERALSILECHCAPDDKYAAGVVNSIYFDTPGLAAYRETLNGDNVKTKVRLRWYGLPDELPEEVPAFIEVKGRVGSARQKSHQETVASRELLTNVSLDGWELADFLFARATGLGVALSSELRPVCVISYNRRRYFDPPTASRIALDWNIRCERFNRAVFPWASPVFLDVLVCEFKNVGGTPPGWSAHMMNAGLRVGRFSKYGECMSRLLSGGTQS
jgi:hypothetical protein